MAASPCALTPTTPAQAPTGKAFEATWHDVTELRSAAGRAGRPLLPPPALGEHRSDPCVCRLRTRLPQAFSRASVVPAWRAAGFRERTEITSGLAARQISGSRDRRLVGPYFYCLRKHEIDQALNFKNRSAKFLEQGANQLLEIPKSPPPGGLPGKLNISIVAARRLPCRPLIQRATMGRWAAMPSAVTG
jgi:hypothetical protein